MAEVSSGTAEGEDVWGSEKGPRAENTNLGFIRTQFAQALLMWLREGEEEKAPGLEKLQHLKAQKRKNQQTGDAETEEKQVSYHRTKASESFE